jgi:hypothetical protein
MAVLTPGSTLAKKWHWACARGYICRSRKYLTDGHLPNLERTILTPVTKEQDGGISKVKLALGAASLFFFLIGLKRSFRKDDGSEVLDDAEPTFGDRVEQNRRRPTLRAS